MRQNRPRGGGRNMPGPCKTVEFSRLRRLDQRVGEDRLDRQSADPRSDRPEISTKRQDRGNVVERRGPRQQRFPTGITNNLTDRITPLRRRAGAGDKVVFLIIRSHIGKSNRGREIKPLAQKLPTNRFLRAEISRHQGNLRSAQPPLRSPRNTDANNVQARQHPKHLERIRAPRTTSLAGQKRAPTDQMIGILQRALRERGLNEAVLELFSGLQTSRLETTELPLCCKDFTDLILLVIPEHRTRKTATPVSFAQCIVRVAGKHLTDAAPLAEALTGFVKHREHFRRLVGGIARSVRFGVRPEATMARDMPQHDRKLRRTQQPIERRNPQRPRVKTKCQSIARPRLEQSMLHQKPAHGIHPLAPAAHHPPHTTLFAPHRVGRSAFLIGLGCIEHPRTACNYAAARILDLQHRPADRRNAGINSENTHTARLPFCRGPLT